VRPLSPHQVALNTAVRRGWLPTSQMMDFMFSLGLPRRVSFETFADGDARKPAIDVLGQAVAVGALSSVDTMMLGGYIHKLGFPVYRVANRRKLDDLITEYAAREAEARLRRGT
jgi:hypothetical protein